MVITLVAVEVDQDFLATLVLVVQVVAVMVQTPVMLLLVMRILVAVEAVLEITLLQVQQAVQVL
jgi:hypothetical protein